MADSRTCPKCLSAAVEEVGHNYFYCNGCASMWNIVAKAKPWAAPQSWAASQKSKTPESTPIAPSVPRPGTIEPTTDREFPT